MTTTELVKLAMELPAWVWPVAIAPIFVLLNRQLMAKIRHQWILGNIQNGLFMVFCAIAVRLYFT